MPWLPQDDGEQQRGPRGGSVHGPQRIQCNKCHSTTTREWWNAKEAWPTGVYFPDSRGYKSDQISWCPRCAVEDTVYGARVQQSMTARELGPVEELMRTHWASAVPPPVSATMLPPATAIVPTQVVAEQEPSLPAPPEPPTVLDMIRVLQDEIAALKSRIEQLEAGYCATHSTFLPFLHNLDQRIEQLESARASSAPAERRGRRALQRGDSPVGDC